MPNKAKSPNRYGTLLERIFFNHWDKGIDEFVFSRTELEEWAGQLKVRLPKNLGDLLYSFRFRSSLPEKIRQTETQGKEWRIELAGRAKYRFVLGSPSRVVPREDLVEIKIPDATPELIEMYALKDEQALLAVVRYNRLIDIFLGIATYSLQSHFRTTVQGIGQIEIDELYVGIDKTGSHYVIPVQAKGGTDQLSTVQAAQDLAACAEKFPAVKCRAISVQFLKDRAVAMFELVRKGNEIKVAEERHYRLVPKEALEPEV